MLYRVVVIRHSVMRTYFKSHSIKDCWNFIEARKNQHYDYDQFSVIDRLNRQQKQLKVKNSA